MSFNHWDITKCIKIQNYSLIYLLTHNSTHPLKKKYKLFFFFFLFSFFFGTYKRSCWTILFLDKCLLIIYSWYMKELLKSDENKKKKLLAVRNSHSKQIFPIQKTILNWNISMSFKRWVVRLKTTAYTDSIHRKTLFSHILSNIEHYYNVYNNKNQIWEELI